MDIKNFVTYEQALTLKKLGFREKCLYYYFNGALYPNDVYAHRIDRNSFHRRYNVESLGKVRNIAKEPLVCDAPTLSQAQKWLIKEKKYYVNPDADVSESWLWVIVNLRNSDLICMWNQTNQPTHYNTYEEALSAGITKCLKILNK